MKQVILTGGTGFVGANLARRLLQEGHEVHLLVRSEHSSWRIESIRDSIQLHSTHLTDSESVEVVIEKIKPDWIFHLAAHGAYSWQTNIHQIVATNITGTMNLVNACLKTGFETFINTGSSSEYGYKDHAPAENEWIDPNSHYAITKATATHFCRYTAQTQEHKIVTLRLYSVYGAYEEPNRLMPTMIMNGLQGKFPPLVNPDIARDYIYTEDVNDAYLQVATQPVTNYGAVYNIGTGIQTTLRDVVNVAQDVMNITDEPQWGSMENRHWDTNIWVANPQKIQQELNWKPRHTFAEGFAKMVNWFKENPQIHSQYTK